MANPPPMPPPTANRTDLNVPATIQGAGQPNGQPVQVPTGTPYGEAGQLQQAQQAVPLPQAPQPGAAPGGAPQPVDMGSALAAAKAHAPPQLGALTRPTERPHEPVTAGLPGSPQPQTGAAPRQVGSLSSMIAAVAAVSGNAALSQLAARAAAFGQ